RRGSLPPFPTRRSSDLARGAARGRRLPHARLRRDPDGGDAVRRERPRRVPWPMPEALLETVALSRRFGGLLAVDAVDFQVESGRSEEHTSELQSRVDLV